jgi:hypothetical protein
MRNPWKGYSVSRLTTRVMKPDPPGLSVHVDGKSLDAGLGSTVGSGTNSVTTMLE